MVFRATPAPAWAFPTPKNNPAFQTSPQHLKELNMKPSSKFDIIVYGATGFTGQLVAEYLAAHYRNDSSLKWAMAAGSFDKLASVRDAIGAAADTPLIAADAGNPSSLQAMVGQTKSVLS